MSLFLGEKFASYLIDVGNSLELAIQVLNQNANGFGIVVDSDFRLVGTLTDGDVRRGLLKGKGLNDSVVDFVHHHPVVGTVSDTEWALRRRAIERNVKLLPILDSAGILTDIYIVKFSPVSQKLNNSFVIFAGGKGTRLLPLTENVPKALLPHQGKSLIQHVIDKAKDQGFNHFVLCTGHLSEQLEKALGDGQRQGIKLSYSREQIPLGTAGGLASARAIIETYLPVVVTNCDVLSEIDYSQLLEFHSENQSDVTMVTRSQSWQNPFGVISLEGIRVSSIAEKPIQTNQINAGIYVFNPSIFDLLEVGEPKDMVTFLAELLSLNKRIIAFPLYEDWKDLGLPTTYRNPKQS